MEIMNEQIRIFVICNESKLQRQWKNHRQTKESRINSVSDYVMYA